MGVLPEWTSMHHVYAMFLVSGEAFKSSGTGVIVSFEPPCGC